MRVLLLPTRHHRRPPQTDPAGDDARCSSRCIARSFSMEAEGSSSQPPPVLLLRPTPHQPPSLAVSRGDGGVVSDAEQGDLVHEMVEPMSKKNAPLFTGPPPERPENPVIRDPLFGKALPTPTDCFTLAAAWARPRANGHHPGEPCAAPSLVWVETFCCLDHGRRRRRIAASA
uniref:Uncharacterized protein n=1 Tax=Oryza rufipogon TaxID=4529 RepID=A0A0E0MX25_ORYRU